MPAPVQPCELSPAERLREVASIFAAGVLRLRKRRQLAGEPAATHVAEAPKFAAGRLEISGETVLSVLTG